ncbi:MAG: homoserine dehydrogenase [Chloroflexi bacterium]|nr:homoserine dehydrogenase [Chloroflexota bacterium]
MATPVRILLVGFGRVGQAFARLLHEKHAQVANQFGLDLQLAGIASSRATWTPGRGKATLTAVLSHMQEGQGLDTLPGVTAGWDGARAIQSLAADILVEATVGGLADGEPCATHLRLALAQGWHAAVASKGALVRQYRELRELARRSNARLRFGAATAAALPTVDFAEFCLAGGSITRIEGILNGTCNFILTEMAHGRLTFEEALQAARARGIAEPDSRLDVEGLDTAAKLVLIANALWDADLRLDDVRVSSITGLRPADMIEAARAGGSLKLLGALWWEKAAGAGEPPRLHASVAPSALPPDHPLARVDGAEKGAVFETDTFGRLAIAGGASSPRGAAAALLRDVIHLARPTLADERRPRQGDR